MINKNSQKYIFHKWLKFKYFYRTTAPFFLLLFLLNTLFAQDNQKNLIFDGPHIFYNNDSLIVKYYDSEVTKTFKIKMDEVTTFNGFLRDSIDTYTIPQKFESSPDNYTNVKKIFVVSDIHGQYDVFEELLKVNGIISQNNSWAWGDGHLVILGDVFDKGKHIHEVLWLIYNLEHQAETVGGKVHFLLGNHEVKGLRGDLKYVQENYFTIAESFSITVPELYLENTFWGRWLRSKNILMQIDSLLFVHGGIHPEIIEKYSSISEINKIMKENIDMSLEGIKESPTLSLLFRKNGPIRFRGFFHPDSIPEVSNEQLTTILSHFNFKKIIVGHTSRDNIYTTHGNRIIGVDCGIRYGQHAEGLFIKNNIYNIVNNNGEIKPLFK